DRAIDFEQGLSRLIDLFPFQNRARVPLFQPGGFKNGGDRLHRRPARTNPDDRDADPALAARRLPAAHCPAFYFKFCLPPPRRVMYFVRSCLEDGSAEFPFGRQRAASMLSAGAALK